MVCFFFFFKKLLLVCKEMARDCDLYGHGVVFLPMLCCTLLSGASMSLDMCENVEFRIWHSSVLPCFVLFSQRTCTTLPFQFSVSHCILICVIITYLTFQNTWWRSYLPVAILQHLPMFFFPLLLMTTFNAQTCNQYWKHRFYRMISEAVWFHG